MAAVTATILSSAVASAISAFAKTLV